MNVLYDSLLTLLSTDNYSPCYTRLHKTAIDEIDRIAMACIYKRHYTEIPIF